MHLAKSNQSMFRLPLLIGELSLGSLQELARTILPLT